MSFQINLDPFDQEYAHFVAKVRAALRVTFEDEADKGLTQRELAETLGVDESVISKRLNAAQGNMTLRSLSDLYVAMGREPLSNFETPMLHVNHVTGTAVNNNPLVELSPSPSMSNWNNRFQRVAA